MSYPFLRLQHVHTARPYAKRRGVSRVALSDRGFVTAYQMAAGDPALLSTMRDPHSGENWWHRRDNFIERHLAQAEKTKEKLWEKDTQGQLQPTRRHLAFLMWAYTPTPEKTVRWLRRVNRSK